MTPWSWKSGSPSSISPGVMAYTLACVCYLYPGCSPYWPSYLSTIGHSLVKCPSCPHLKLRSPPEWHYPTCARLHRGQIKARPPIQTPKGPCGHIHGLDTIFYGDLELLPSPMWVLFFWPGEDLTVWLYTRSIIEEKSTNCWKFQTWWPAICSHKYCCSPSWNCSALNSSIEIRCVAKCPSSINLQVYYFTVIFS